MGRTNHIITGIRWTLITSIIRRILTLFMFYFIAKWLSKEDLGIFRTYSLLLSLIAVFGCFSAEFLYVIERKLTRIALAALCQTMLLSSILLYILLTLGSNLIGGLYKSTELAILFRYASVFAVVEIVRRGLRAMTSKALMFRELALAETYNVFFYSLAAVVLLFLYRFLIVYVVVYFIGNLLETAYLWHLHKKSILRILQSTLKKPLILLRTFQRYRTFLTQATLVSVINQFSGNAPILILGMFVEPLYLGLYFFSSQLIGVPVGMFSTALNQVFFPVFSSQQDNRIQSMALRYVSFVGYIGLPLLLMYCHVMMHGVNWLWGDKWKDAIPLIPMMFLVSGASLYSNPIGGIPFIKRKPEWELVWNIVALIVKVGAMIAGLRVSFMTAILFYAVASALMSISFYVMSMHLLMSKPLKTLKKIMISMIPVLAYSVFLYFVKAFAPLYSVISAVIGCGLLLLGLNALLKGNLLKDMRQFVTSC